MRSGVAATALAWTVASGHSSSMVKPLPTRVSEPEIDFTAADEATLVAAFRAGRTGAFDEIVTRHRKQIYQLCYRFVRNHEDASDLAQDVFVRAFKGLQRFKGDSSLTTWLHRIGVNACLNRVAAKKPLETSIEAARHVDAAAVDPLQAVLQHERAAAVREAIAKLPPKQRATLVLRIYQECSHEEIAASLGGTVGAAKANLFHALGNLRRALGLKP
jgi:RNA polymerase sigma-70 factor, ECF subfamily